MPTSKRLRLPFGNLDATITRLDAIIFGGWAPRLDGMVQTTRTFAYHGGFNADGSLTPDGTVVIPDGTTKFVQRLPDGAVSADATLDVVNKMPMAIVTAAGGLLTHFEDIRDVGMWYARAQLLALFGSDAGDLVYSDGSGPIILPVGANPDGYVLTLAAGLPAWAAPSGGGGGGGSLWDKTVLQLHYEGANNSTVFTDQKGRTVTPSGNAKITTGDHVFGSSCAIFDGTGDFLTVSAHKSFNLSGAGSIALRIKTTQTGRQNCTLIERDNGSFASGSWALLFNYANNHDGKLAWYHSGAAPGGIASTSVVNDGNWHGASVDWVGGLHMLYFDGSLEAWASSNADFGANTADILIGKSVNATRDYDGLQDELSVVKGAPRHTTDYTLETAAFPDS